MDPGLAGLFFGGVVFWQGCFLAGLFFGNGSAVCPGGMWKKEDKSDPTFPLVRSPLAHLLQKLSAHQSAFGRKYQSALQHTTMTPLPSQFSQKFLFVLFMAR